MHDLNLCTRWDSFKLKIRIAQCRLLPVFFARKKKRRLLFAQLSRVQARLKTTLHKIIIDAKFHNTLYSVELAEWHKWQVLGRK